MYRSPNTANARLSNTELSHLSKAPLLKLKRLVLNGNYFTASGVTFLSKGELPLLEKLSIVRCNIEPHIGRELMLLESPHLSYLELGVDE
jgi:hypothetical protein